MDHVSLVTVSGDGVKEVNEGEEGKAAKTCQGSVQQEKSRTNKENERFQKSKRGSQIIPRSVNIFREAQKEKSQQNGEEK